MSALDSWGQLYASRPASKTAVPTMKLEFRLLAAPIRGQEKVNAKMVSGIVEDIVKVVISAPEVRRRFKAAIFIARFTAMYNRGMRGAPLLPGSFPKKALTPAQK